MSRKNNNSNNHNDDLIIDVQGSKILEWLIERNKVPAQWKKNNGSLRKMIETTMQSNPPLNNTKYSNINIQDINYFQCLDIFKDFESQPNGGAKTLLGYYSNPNTQKWSEVIKAYQKDSLYIGESCQRFTQALNYDIPNMKKIVEKTIKSLDDSNKRETELNKSKDNSQNQFKRSCNELGIKGEKIRDEIMELPNVLDSLFDNAINLLKDTNIPLIIDFYIQTAINTKCELKEKDKLFNFIQFINKYGNISVGEREKILNPSIIVKSTQESTTVAPAGGIDWDFSVEETNDQIDDKINWDDFAVVDDISSPTLDDFSMMDTIEVVEESNQDISSPPTVTETTNNNSNTKIIENANDSVLSDRFFRNVLLDELYELEVFLKQRTVEMGEPEHEFGIDQMNESVNSQQCKQYSKLITDIILQLTNQKLIYVLELKSSKKYIDRMSLQFNQKLHNINKYIQMLNDLQERRSELNSTLIDTKKKLDIQSKETKQLKSNLEGLLADVMDDKKINIMMPYVL